jgi:hypothetical protein
VAWKVWRSGDSHPGARGLDMVPNPTLT